ncbi:ubiquitin-related modifier 1 [Mycena floridula]|nr:ubiquitin-related modifier 1 [Mycena floridula]
MRLRIEFSGGLELLFSNRRSHTLEIPDTISVAGQSKAPDVNYLIQHLHDHLLTERPELFVENGTVRPGILVLINDTDWELEGEGNYILQQNDEIVFISTLHGG